MRQHFIGKSLEAIGFQKEKAFFLSLAALSERLVLEEKKLFSKIPLEMALLITHHTHIKATVNIVNDSSPNAAAYPPKIDINHPLIPKELRGKIEGSRQGQDLILRKLSTIGYVNLEEGKVYGAYREIPVSIHLNKGLFAIEMGLSGQEIAAIILHEIGHCFGYFEFLGSKVTRNLAMVSIVEHLFGTDASAHEQRVELITLSKVALHLETLDVKRLTEVKSKQEAILLLIDAEASRLRSELGTDFYDATSFEYVSDQYMARQGAALAFITAYKKSDPFFNDSSFLSSVDFMALEASKFLLFLLTTVLTAGVFAVYTVCVGVTMNPLLGKYDQPKARFIRIRQQIIAQISRTDDRELKRQLLDDIAMIDSVLKDMNEHRSLYEYIFTTFVKSHRKDLSQQQIQKDLEAIGMNDIFVSAAKLQTLL
jgi:hypothetical protein